MNIKINIVRDKDDGLEICINQQRVTLSGPHTKFLFSNETYYFGNIL